MEYLFYKTLAIAESLHGLLQGCNQVLLQVTWAVPQNTPKYLSENSQTISKYHLTIFKYLEKPSKYLIVLFLR